MAIYTPRIKAQVQSIPIPVEFTVDIVEYDFVPPYIGLRFYESQWKYFSESERLKAIVYLTKIKEVIQAHGINVTIDPVYDMPGVQQLG